MAPDPETVEREDAPLALGFLEEVPQPAKGNGVPEEDGQGHVVEEESMRAGRIFLQSVPLPAQFPRPR